MYFGVQALILKFDIDAGKVTKFGVVDAKMGNKHLHTVAINNGIMTVCTRHFQTKQHVFQRVPLTYVFVAFVV